MRRLGNKCLDCGQKLEEKDNFCPNCGQENSEKQLRLKNLLEDFFSNYFSFDSKIGRSLRFFFFKPGYLTSSYNEGKRIRYIHPLRLYLIITFLFFLTLSYLITIQLDQVSFQLISKNKKAEIGTSLPDSLAPSAELQQISGISSAVDLRKNNYKQIITLEKGIGLLSNLSLEDRIVMDSLGISEARQKNESFQMLFHQFRRVVQKDLDVFIPHLLKNLPIMMFILLPLFAFFLKKLFRNQPNLYIPHVIHSLHIHSMAFLLLTIFIITGWLSNVYFFWITFLLISLYSFLSIKYVYKQPLLQTACKFILLGMFYFSSVFLFVMLEVGISFLTF